MYTVEVRHHTKNYRRGDLEDTLELIESNNFKTRTAGKEWIEQRLSNKPQKNIQRYYRKGDMPSNCYYFTGMTWIHENTGEEMQEYYQYTLRKGKLN